MSYAYSKNYQAMMDSITEDKEEKKSHGSGVKKAFQDKKGGLNDKGRAHFKKKENGGHDLKPPVSKKAAKKSPKKAGRRKSFCARMGGQKKMHKINCAKTPDKAICKALSKWDC